jgi:hypothetical protein
MIIDRTEKNRILKLYGLINENNIIYEQTTTLTKDTEFDVSGSGTNWVITLLSSDKKYYPLSQFPNLDKSYNKYKEKRTSERDAKNLLGELKKSLDIDPKNKENSIGASNNYAEKPELLAKIAQGGIPTSYDEKP